MADEERPISLFDVSPGDEQSTDASSATRSSEDLRSDAGDWLERRADIPRVVPGKSLSGLWPPPKHRQPLQSPKKAPLVSDVSDPGSAESGLRIFATRRPVAELEGSSIPAAASENENDTQEPFNENWDPQRNISTEIDEDERALAEAIELSLRTQNRYTANGTNLEELQQALANSRIHVAMDSN